MAKLRVVVVGYGYWGPSLVRNFSKISACEVVAVADCETQHLDVATESYPGIETACDASALICREDIDAVAVATPPSFHFPLAKRALEYGKHVLVEKPITRAASEAEELVRLARSMRRTLMVDHTFVYAGAVRKLREIIRSGELGEVRYVDSVRVDSAVPPHEVNVIEDRAPHDFSILDYVFDSEPRTVSATSLSLARNAVEASPDLAYVTVHLDNGILAHFQMSWLSPVKIRRMVVAGSKRMLVYDHSDPDEPIKINEHGLDAMTEGECGRQLVAKGGSDWHAPEVDRTEPLARVCQHFVECALSGGTPLTDGAAGLKVVRLMEAAQQSMQLGGASVSLTGEESPAFGSRHD